MRFARDFEGRFICCYACDYIAGSSSVMEYDLAYIYCWRKEKIPSRVIFFSPSV